MLRSSLRRYGCRTVARFDQWIHYFRLPEQFLQSHRADASTVGTYSADAEKFPPDSAGSARRPSECACGNFGSRDDRDRIEFVEFQPRGNYLEVYRKIDIGLDTVPYNGHTTSLDSFWMGVPVVTRIGSTVVGRAGWSQLQNLGMKELAAESEQQFVAIATELAGNINRLTELRATLRRRMELSPLMNHKRFARNMEAAYIAMWAAYCSS